MKMKPSNPIPKFRYKPGNEPYYVNIRLSNWIPISIVVFADNKNEAVETVKSGIKFALKNKKNLIPEDAPKLLSDEAEIFVCKLDKTQLYGVGWAVNDTVFGDNYD